MEGNDVADSSYLNIVCDDIHFCNCLIVGIRDGRCNKKQQS